MAIEALSEFQRTYSYRETHSRADDGAEMRALPDGTSLFHTSLVLRLHFAGRGLVKLATDR